MNSTQIETCKRPGYLINSKIGQQVTLSSNYVGIKFSEESRQLYQYKVTISRNQRIVTNREELVQLFWKIFESNNILLPARTKVVFDDHSKIYSTTKFNIQEKSLEIVINNNKKGEVYEYCIEFVDLVEFDRNARNLSHRILFNEVVQLVLTQRIRCNSSIASDNHEYFSQSFYINDKTIDIIKPLGYGVVELTGISIRLLNNLAMGDAIEIGLVSDRYYRANTPLILVIMEIIRGRPLCSTRIDQYMKDLSDNKMKPHQFEMVVKYLEHMSVNTCIVSKHGKSVGAKLTFQSAKDITVKRNDVEIGLLEYYAAYDIQIKYPEIPCVELHSSCGELHFVPLEYINTTGKPVKYVGNMKLNDDSKTKNASVSPHARLKIMETLALKGGKDFPPILSNDDWLQEFRIELETNLVTVPTTILPAPPLIFGNQILFDDAHTGRWSFVDQNGFKKCAAPMRSIDNKSKRLFISVIKVLDFEDSPDASPDLDISKIHHVLNGLESMGIFVQRDDNNVPHIVETTTIHPSEKVKEIRQKLQNIKSLVENDRKLLELDIEPVIVAFFVFPKSGLIHNDVNIYGLLMHLCTHVVGLHFQSIHENMFVNIRSNLENCRVSQKLVAELMAKIGCTWYWLERYGENRCWTKLTNEEEPTLVLGIDVSHNLDNEKSPSFSAELSFISVVGNLDFRVSKFGESVAPLKAGEVTYEGLDDLISARIFKFMEVSHRKPSHIVLFRSDTNDVDMKDVMSKEVNKIKVACMDICEGYSPTITYIIINTHHSTYLLPGNDIGSIRVGSVVETNICNDHGFDFFLFSQQDCPKPTYYSVMYDEWQPSVGFWQTICHSLCSNLVLLNGSIEVPCVIRYAQLSSCRARDRLEGLEQLRKELNLPFDAIKAIEDPAILHALLPHPNVQDLYWC